MSERKLSSEQVQALFVFCNNHRVYQYDLQIELVDHMAASIETFWETEPEVPFVQALNKTYKSFGINGFSKIKVEKEKALRKKYNRLLWKFVGEYFKLPKIILTTVISMFLFLLLHYTNIQAFLVSSYLILFLPFGLLYYFYLFPKYFQIKVTPGKSFLLINYLKKFDDSFLFMIWVPTNSFPFFNLLKHTNNIWINLIVAVTLTFITIVLYANCFFVPRKVREHFTEQFPQFVKS